MCWGPLCVALKEPNKSHRKIRKPRWQAQPDAKTEGSHGKSGLINTLYPLKLDFLCTALSIYTGCLSSRHKE